MRRVRRGPKTLAHLISGTARLCKNRKVQAAVESRPIRLQNALNPRTLRSPAHPRPVAAPAAGGGMSYLAWPRLALYQSAGRAATMCVLERRGSGMKRRRFLAALGGMAVAWPFSILAQKGPAR